MKKISVIVPVYNSEKYLVRCIESILNQTLDNFELILVDDGSTDSSGRICDEYAGNDERITVIHKKNSGVSSARNAGIDMATGEYITFIDSDDYIETNFLFSAYEDALLNGADIYLSGLVMETMNDDEIVRSDVYSAQLSRIYNVRTLLEGMNSEYPLICICGPWCKLFRTTIIKNYTITFDVNMNLGEDTLFNLHFLKHTEVIFFSEKVFYHYYRGNTNSLFSAFNKSTYEIHTRVYDEMRNLMLSENCKNQVMPYFEEMYYDLLVAGIHKFYGNMWVTTRRERVQQIKKVQNNKYIKKLTIKQVKGIKRKVLLFLLKLDLNYCVAAIFALYYRVLMWIKVKEL